MRSWKRLPRLVRFLILHGLTGFALSSVLVGALLAADPGDARRLLLEAAGHWWPALLLWFFAGLTFGSVQIGVAVMLLAGGDSAPRGGTPMRSMVQPARAPATAQRRARPRVVQRCQT